MGWTSAGSARSEPHAGAQGPDREHPDRGIDGLFKSNKITKLPGHGKLLADNKVLYTPLDGGTAEEIQARHIILASGSKPVEIGVAPIDNELIVDSWGALDSLKSPNDWA